MRGGRLAPRAVRGGVDGARRLGGGAEAAQDGGEDPVDGARVLGDAQVDVRALGERVGVGAVTLGDEAGARAAVACGLAAGAELLEAEVLGDEVLLGPAECDDVALGCRRRAAPPRGAAAERAP